jgi:hydroxymethylglutaryl-CoA reductase
MVENAVGSIGVPLGIATNFQINGRDVLIPMATEEASIIAGASNAARLVRPTGGFEAQADHSLMIGQIQVIDLPIEQLEEAAAVLMQREPELLAKANAAGGSLPRRGGGARSLDVRTFAATAAGPMLVVHVVYDVRDAMGANIVNSVCEALAPEIGRLTGGNVVLRILTNLADRRLARARCSVRAADLSRPRAWPPRSVPTHSQPAFDGREVVRRIVAAQALAEVDVYRAATHNKGIMNGIDAVLVATGNDWRAVEAAAHAYAARDGRYGPLSRWWISDGGDLAGEVELPVARAPGGPGRARLDGRHYGAPIGRDRGGGRTGPEPCRVARPGR